MMSMVSRIVLLVLLGLSSVSCVDFGSEVGEPMQMIEENYSYIDDPEARWRAYGLVDYVIEEERGCFCVYGGEYCKVYVKKNQVLDVVVLSNGGHVPEQFQPAYKTVDDLFTFVHSIKPDSVAYFQVEYDSRFGYPKRVAVDYSKFIADEEIAYHIRAIYHLPK